MFAITVLLKHLHRIHHARSHWPLTKLLNFKLYDAMPTGLLKVLNHFEKAQTTVWTCNTISPVIPRSFESSMHDTATACYMWGKSLVRGGTTRELDGGTNHGASGNMTLLNAKAPHSLIDQPNVHPYSQSRRSKTSSASAMLLKQYKCIRIYQLGE